MIPTTYCVVVNYNLKDDTIACVQSLFDASAEPSKVIVVDNGSTDGSVQCLKERFGSAVNVISTEKNLGFSGGYNLGIQNALELGANWVLIINNDTLVTKDFLSELGNAIGSQPQYDIFGPLIFYYNSPQRIWYLGDRLIPGLLITHSLYRGQKERAHYPPFFSVDFITGCAMLIKREVFEKIGYFDVNLFMYGEDVDFCWRARKAGFKLAVIPSARMWHKVSASASRDQYKSRYLRTRNQSRFYRVYSRRLQIPFMWVFSLLKVTSIGFFDIVYRRPTLITPLVMGWIDGWLNRYRQV